MDLKEICWEDVNWVNLVQGRDTLTGCCECGNEPCVSIKMKEFSWLAEEPLASQEGLWSMELVTLLINILNTLLSLAAEIVNSEHIAHRVRLHWNSPAIFNRNVGRELFPKFQGVYSIGSFKYVLLRCCFTLLCKVVRKLEKNCREHGWPIIYKMLLMKGNCNWLNMLEYYFSVSA